MKAEKQSATPSFREITESAFAFLISDFGFSLSSENTDYHLIYERQDCKLMLWDERGDLIVSLSFNFPNPLTAFENKYGFGLWLIAICLNPDIRTEMQKPKFQPGDYQGQANWGALLLSKYCTPILNGDFSFLSKIEPCIAEYMRQANEEWDKAKKEAKRKSEERRLDGIREKARIAWQGKDYAKVIELYESLVPNLTPTENKKLEYAWKKFANN